MNIMFGEVMKNGGLVVNSISLDGVEYNKTDLKILSTLSKEELSVGDLTKKVGVAHINIWKRLKILDENKLIDVPDVEKGKKKIIKLTKAGRDLSHILNLEKRD